MIDVAKARFLIRSRGPAFAADAVVNFVLPYAIYSYASPRIGDVHALVASSVPPILWSVIEFIRYHRLDTISLMVLAGIVLSLLAFIGGGGPQMLQLREKLVTGLIGTAFLLSAAVRRPLIYEIAKASTMRRNDAAAARLHELSDNPYFRRSMMVITIVWGLGLMVDVAIAAVLIFTLTIKEYMVVNPFEGYGIMGALGLWTLWYARRAEARGQARRSAAAPK